MVGRAKLVELALRTLVPGAAALTLLAIVTDSGRVVKDELHLVAPDEVVPGQLLPVRAQLYAGLNRPEGPVLIAAPVLVELRQGATRIAVALTPSHAGSLEGMLQIPGGLRGDALLDAHATLDGVSPSAQRTLRITPGARPLSLSDRPLPPLRRFSAGPVVAQAAAGAPPAALAARIGGGQCVPEIACELFVHVGAPAAGLALVPSASITPEPSSARPSEETAGVVRLRFVVHGPEALVTLAATRAGVPVATRALRMALGLGTSAVLDSPRILGEPSALRLGLHGDERGCIVDAFHDRHWLRTAALADCRGGEQPRWPPLAAGLWRLQLRRDPFSAESAGVRNVYVRGSEESDAEVLRVLANAAYAQDPQDAFAAAVRADPGTYVGGFATAAGYLIAVLDEGIILLPRPVSGLPRALAQHALARARVRTLALYALGLCALAVGLFVAQRGLAAAAEAQHLMSDAGEDPVQLDRQRLRMTLRVIAAICSLMLAFLALAAYMVARSPRP